MSASAGQWAGLWDTEMLYHIAVFLLRLLLPLYFRIRVHNRPKDFPRGGLIISGNHSVWLDPVWIAMAVPRRIHFLAKEEFFQNPVLAFLFRAAGFHPVKRGRPDRRVIRFAGERLGEGAAVGIFPEGTRNKDGLGKAHNGAAYIALRSGVPIMPVSIDYSSLGFRSEIHLRFHPLIETGAGSGTGKEALDRVTGELMEAIASGLELR